MSHAAKIRKVTAGLSLVVAATIGLLLVIEGAASWALGGWKMVFPHGPGFGWSHAQYDSMLGWVSVPGKKVPDAFGPGASVSINSRGFRGDEVGSDTPGDRLRAVCSGDSFTFGWGVGDRETWCHALSEITGTFETVNLGQSAYGADQAYLLYRRDGLELDPDIHLFAFINGDLQRMSRPRQSGFAKPVLVIDDGQLRLGGVPVPRRGPALARALQRGARELSLIQFGLRVVRRLTARKRRALVASEPARVERLARRLFREVQDLNTRNDVVTVFVYLPIQNDVPEDLVWYQMAKSITADLGVVFVDLTPELRGVPQHELPTLFLPDGHYNAAGHRWVAEHLAVKLKELPAVERVFNEVVTGGGRGPSAVTVDLAPLRVPR